MAIRKEFVCPAHGPFESVKAICPRGCTVVQREFRTAPAFVGSRTQSIDRTLDGLAKSYGFTNMSNKSGSIKQAAQAQPPERDYRKLLEKQFGGNSVITRDGGIGMWGGIPKGGTYQPGVGAKDEGPGVPAALAQRHAQPDNVLSQLQPALPSVASMTTVRHDQDKLQVTPALVEKAA